MHYIFLISFGTIKIFKFQSCEDTIRDEPNSVGFAREKAQTISFVERGCKELG